MQPATVRVMLRKHGVQKAEDRVYGWNNQADYKAVVAQLKGKGDDKPAAKKTAAKGKSKPAAKGKSKSAAKAAANDDGGDE